MLPDRRANLEHALLYVLFAYVCLGVCTGVVAAQLCAAAMPHAAPPRAGASNPTFPTRTPLPPPALRVRLFVLAKDSNQSAKFNPEFP